MKEIGNTMKTVKKLTPAEVQAEQNKGGQARVAGGWIGLFSQRGSHEGIQWEAARIKTAKKTP